MTDKRPYLCARIMPVKWDVRSAYRFERYGLGEFLDATLVLLDQTELPWKREDFRCERLEDVVESIKKLRVRGAPAIGIAAAYGLCVALQQTFGVDEDAVVIPSEEAFFARLDEAAAALAASRPTAVNLFWALDRMTALARSLRGVKSVVEIANALLAEARAIHEEDFEMCRRMGRYGAALVRDGGTYLTHCNAGALATGGYGTALAVFYWAQEEEKKRIHVFADETRPLFQGSRLTAWELAENDVDVTVICDNMAASIMRKGQIDAAFVGADRIAANGDVANKIGTYSVAVNCRAHGVPFYVVAPRSTFDLNLENGDGIPIEERASEEIRHGFYRLPGSDTPTIETVKSYKTAPDDVKIYNPAFDVTPSELITGIVTENGVISPVTPELIAEIVGKNRLVEDVLREN